MVRAKDIDDPILWSLFAFLSSEEKQDSLTTNLFSYYDDKNFTYGEFVRHCEYLLVIKELRKISEQINERNKRKK